MLVVHKPWHYGFQYSHNATVCVNIMKKCRTHKGNKIFKTVEQCVKLSLATFWSYIDLTRYVLNCCSFGKGGSLNPSPRPRLALVSHRIKQASLSRSAWDGREARFIRLPRCSISTKGRGRERDIVEHNTVNSRKRFTRFLISRFSYCAFHSI